MGLREIYKEVKEEIDEWSRRTGKSKKPPYPADSPCYYCQFAEHGWSRDSDRESPEACDFCIHNPGAVIYDEVRDG